MVSEVTRYKKGGQVEKRRPGIKMAEKGPKKFSRFMRHFPTTRNDGFGSEVFGPRFLC